MNDYIYFRMEPGFHCFHIRVKFVSNQTYKIKRGSMFKLITGLYELSPAEALASGGILDVAEEEEKLRTEAGRRNNALL